MEHKISQQLLGLVVILVGILTHASLVRSQPAPTVIGNLANGKYQFCSQPKPNDWRDGAGVCLNFAKVGNLIDGYYGYPHSNIFICIRGSSVSDTIRGQALGIFGFTSQPNELPQNHLEWDVEKRLRLGRGKVIRNIRDRRDQTDWILFQDASLNPQGFYQYRKPQMTSASKLCDWSIVSVSG
jgi:hypothetical protein